MRHRNDPKLPVITKNNHLGFYASLCEAKGIGSAGEFVSLAHDFAVLCAEKINHFFELCIHVFDIFYLALPDYSGDYWQGAHSVCEALKIGEVCAHVLDFFCVLIWVAECLFSVHDYTVNPNLWKAKPSTRRGLVQISQKCSHQEFTFS